MAEGAGLPVPEGTACGEWSWPQRARPQKTKGRRGQVEGVHGVLRDRKEVVREGVNEDTMWIRYPMVESVTKSVVQTRTDFSGEPSVY